MVKYSLEEENENTEAESERKTWDQIFLKEFIFRENKLLNIKNMANSVAGQVEPYLNLNAQKFSKKNAMHKNFEFFGYFFSPLGEIVCREESGLNAASQKKLSKLIRFARSKRLADFKFFIENIRSQALFIFDENDI